MTVEGKSRDLQVFLNNSKRSQHMQLSLIRKRSLVRVQAGPQARIPRFAGKKRKKQGRAGSDGDGPKPDPPCVKQVWSFENVLGAMYLQMHWLLVAGGGVVRFGQCWGAKFLPRRPPLP